MGILWSLFRNQVLLRPRAVAATRVVRDYLAQKSLSPRAIEVHLGLADPSKLLIYVVFSVDAVLSRFEAEVKRAEIDAVALDALRANGYPVEALEIAWTMTFHSHETIMRLDGYRNYFN